MENNKFHEIDNAAEREIAWHYIKTFSDTAREPFIILSPDLKVIGANESFYKNFLVTEKNTVDKFIYDLGDGQWNIPALRVLLENILPEKKVFNDFTVTHEFPGIGKKVMLLNARQLDSTKQILLAIEDITLKKAIEEKLAAYVSGLETATDENKKLMLRLNPCVDELLSLTKATVWRETRINELKAEIVKLRKEQGFKKN